MNATWNAASQVFVPGDSATAISEALAQAADQYRKAAASLRDVDRPRSQDCEAIQNRLVNLAGAVMVAREVPLGGDLVNITMGALRAYIIRLGRVVNAQGICDSPIVAARMQQAHSAHAAFVAGPREPAPLGPPLSNPDEMNGAR